MNQVKGIYLFNSQIDISEFFYFCKDVGVNFIFTNEHFYKNQKFQEIASNNGISICLIFPIYFDKDYLEKNSENYAIDSNGNKAINDWLHFACPSSMDFFEYKKQFLEKLIKLKQPVMVCFDFIRFYVLWEKVNPETNLHDIVDGCYCERCISNFQIFTGVAITHKTPNWIKQNASARWKEWKCIVIEEAMAKLVSVVKKVDKKIQIAINTVPWLEYDYSDAIRSVAGQDIMKLKNYVDLFIPMTYSHIIKRDPEWINQIVKELHLKTNKPILASVEIEKTYGNKDISNKEFSAMMHHGFEKPSTGIVLFHYAFVHSSKKDIKQILNFYSI